MRFIRREKGSTEFFKFSYPHLSFLSPVAILQNLGKRVKKQKKKKIYTPLRGVTCYGLNSHCIPAFAYAVHTAGDCGFDARDLAITAPSARQKRQETAVSPGVCIVLFSAAGRCHRVHRLTGAAIWYKRRSGNII